MQYSLITDRDGTLTIWLFILNSFQWKKGFLCASQIDQSKADNEILFVSFIKGNKFFGDKINEGL